MTRIRVLFVDDEVRVLRGLRNALTATGCTWHLSFAKSAPAALDKLSAQPYDAIVSDMQMPGMDGAALLCETQSRFPNVVRIALSAHTEFEATLRAIPVAHHYLVKPCDVPTLRETVQRACGLQRLICNEAALRCVSRTKHLPAAPRVYTELTQVMARPDASVAEIAAVVERDAAITAKLFHLVNSAAFNLRRKATSVRDAIEFLGLDTLKNLVLALDAFRSLEPEWRGSGFSLDECYVHSLGVGSVARRLLADRTDAQHAFTAGVLHDIGKLVLITQQGEQYSKILAEAAATEREVHEIEEAELGVTHAEIGGLLLSAWHLPYPVVEAVAANHRPQRVQHSQFGVLSAVYVADRLVHECAHPQETPPDLCTSYLRRLNLEGHYDRWQELARQIVNDVAA